MRHPLTESWPGSRGSAAGDCRDDTPTDPLFAQQWHFGKIGDIEKIWDDYTGLGVHVGIYDTGIETGHPDLAANHDASRYFTYNGATYGDGIPGGTTSDPQFHGTSVAGLISAANDGVGGVGVAFGSTFTGINIFDDNTPIYTDAGLVASLHSLAFDVANNSWGYSDRYLYDLNATNPNGIAAKFIAAWADVAANGRGGLGTVVVKAAGNDAWNANAVGDDLDRFSIKVAAVGSADTAASYSNHGADILISAPGSEAASSGGLGIVTTDRTGTAGYNERGDSGGGYDYTNDFGGTSAAAPIVAGVATLMLDANPDLGWRDVQDILALSATRTGSAYGATTPGTNENDVWKFNGADDWNGGGLHFHNNYGVGMVNAYSAVRMAEAWQLFSPSARTSANEQSVVVTTAPALALADNGTLSTTFTVMSDLQVENLNLVLDLQTTRFSDLRIRLIAPDGAVYSLEDGTGNVGYLSYNRQWEYTVAGLHEQSPLGTWTVTIQDVAANGTTGTLRGVTASFTGSAASADDVYHFTDEFQSVAALDAGRRTVHDGNGGADWLDLSAVSGAVNLDLAPDANSTLDGQQFISIAGDAAIENAVTGDGNDTISGNALNNTLYGMRGNDALNGRDGDDTLTGGRGDDIIDGGAGFDTASYADAAAGVTVTLATVGAAQDTAAAGTDTLFNVEQLIGSAYNDKLTLATIVAPGPLVVDDSVDHGGIGSAVQTDQAFVAGAGGTPHVIANVTGSSQKYFQFTVTQAGTATFSVSNATFDAQIQLYTSNNAFIGGSGFSSNHYYYQRSLAPGTYYVSFGSGSAADNATYTFDITVPEHPLALTAATADGGAGNDTLTGSVGIDTLIGGIGADLLDGGLGADRMIGGADNDVYTVDNAFDRAVELAGGGYDRVASSATFHLNANVEALTLTGAAAINGYGNVDANAITGNDAANVLGGKDGDDTLTGAGGADVLDGGRGADTMTGGADNDVYYVDNAGDQVIELTGGGTDKVSASINYTLPDQVEVLIMTGVSRVGTGNALNNAITGTSGNDTLAGMDGADTLKGGDGNDAITGGIGNDVIFGGAGRDTLTGGAGADRFAFLAGDSGPAAAQTDRITDFSHAEGDRVALNQIDANGASPADEAFAFIGTSAFHNVAGELRYAFVGADTLIEGDTSGDGAADLAIRLTGHVTLVAADFVL